ncbi:ABC transporter permease [Corynebacterium vitaeruminis]|uniref:Putative ABC transport system, permease protein n=1 Tax=Corynebacterium vitaeruminis DSM 20294 TaxID=1224164 RepID=W5Y345_9CORY|nr:ABC transporter permease [Corynebacterium vitaeruminis]AHI23329.1 putative ABC transport system, permease protein [Corynebacterium vitaeruminis DSM 20294]
MSSKNSSQGSYSSGQTIVTVAAREIQVVSRIKAVRISIALILILIIGGLAAANYFAGKDSGDGKASMALVGVSAASLPLDSFDVSELSDAQGAEAAVRNGTDYALVYDGSYRLLHDGAVDPAVEAQVRQAVRIKAMNDGLASLGVDPQQFAEATAAPAVEAVDLSADTGPAKDDSYYARLTTTLVGIGALMYLVILFAANVGGRVCEEKSSRVIEIILATVKPLDFLAGKIIGNLIFGTIASLVIVGVGLAGLKATNLGDGVTVDYSVFPLLVVMFVLGMLFFSSLYAAAGSLVSRTEDLQASQMPVMLLIFLTIYAPTFGMNALGSTAMKIFTWIPPTSMTVAPLQYAAGNISVAQLLGAWAIFIAFTVLMMMVVARIYRNAILHNGTRMSWIKALRG